MRKIFSILTALLILTSLISLTSAEIIVKQQPKEVYNLGDSVIIPITVKTISGISKVFEMSLICQDIQRQFFKDGVSLGPGEEKTFAPTLILTKEEIGTTIGTCKIKGQLGENYIITNDFEISNLINMQVEIETLEFNPGENIIIQGNAQKENNKDVNGFLNIEILGGMNDSNDIRQLETIGNGFFSANITFPEIMKAGTYLVKLNAYEIEKDNSETKTNKGFTNYNIQINQVPTSLEINFENPEVQPGTNLKVRGILRDQTGNLIEKGTSIITIKKENQILKQPTIPVGEYYEYPIAYNEPPGEWNVIAVSNKIKSEGKFQILEKKSLEVVIINETINLVNIGNVPYEDLVFIKVGNESREFNASLEVDEVKKYKVKAKESGDYDIEVVSRGEKKAESTITLSGTITANAIDIKQVKSGGDKPVMRRPLAWIFIIMILGFVAFMIWRKGIKKSFFGKIKFRKKTKKKNKAWENKKELVRKPESIVDAKNKAILSLSMTGEKHNSSIICLKIKNLSDIQKTQNNVKQTLNKVILFAEDKKSLIYENQENIFIILSPTKTKTFKNQETALEIAENTIKEITNHNKLFKQLIEFGISLNCGNIITKENPSDKTTHFMSMGNLIAFSKKLSTISNGKILISEEIKEKMKNIAKFQEHKHPGITFYTIKQMKNSTDHSKFLSGFMKRMEKENQEKK